MWQCTFLFFVIIIQLLLMESPEFDYPFKIFLPDNIPYVELAVLHTYMSHSCLHGSCLSNHAFI